MNNRFLTFAIAVGAICFTGFTASAHHGPDGFDRTMQVIDRISRIFFPPVTVVAPPLVTVVAPPPPPVIIRQPAYVFPQPVYAIPPACVPPPRPDWNRPDHHRPVPPPRPGRGGHR